MADTTTPTNGLAPIDLIHTEDFTLGALQIRPALRQVEAGSDSRALEPRVMQVLIAIAQRGGAVVSRDELIERCWEGRAVSEDAINRCIMRVRRLGESTGAFELITITRVGYRIVVSEPSAAPAGVAGEVAAPAKPKTGWLVMHRRLAAGIAGAAVVLIAAVAWLAATLGGGPAPDPSVAVLPFGGAGGDEQRAYVGRAISGEIVELLAQLKGVKVIARNSSFTFKPDADAREVGRKLGVAHVLSGEVSEREGRIGVSATLTEAATGRVIWTRNEATSYAPENVSGVQKRIAEQVAGAMSIAFRMPASSRPAGGGTQNLEAYDNYLRGMDGWWFGGPPSAMADNLARATQLDPNYAEAWAGLAVATGFLSLNQPTPQLARAQQDEGYAMAERAVKLAPGLSMTQAALGTFATTQKKWVQAEEGTLKALSIARDEFPLMHRMMVLARTGRSAEAYDIMREFDAADPLRGTGVIGVIGILPAVGKHDELMKMAEEKGWFTRDDLWYEIDGLMVRVNAHQPASAIRASVESMSRAPNRVVADFANALLQVFDNPEKARAVLRSAREDGSSYPGKWEVLSFLGAWYDDTDLVLRLWQDELPVNTQRTIYIWGEAFSKVRSQPGFKQLARDIGYVEYWRAYRWADTCRPLAGDDFECS